MGVHKEFWRFLVVLLFVSLTGCGVSNKKNTEVNYVVVEVPNGTSINELFEFESISKVVLGTLGELDMDVEEGCYCIGMLQDGGSVIWKSDDDGSGYDDGLFVYVENNVSDAQVASYAARLKETPISYDSFLQKYNIGSN